MQHVSHAQAPWLTQPDGVLATLPSPDPFLIEPAERYTASPHLGSEARTSEGITKLPAPKNPKRLMREKSIKMQKISEKLKLEDWRWTSELEFRVPSFDFQFPASTFKCRLRFSIFYFRISFLDCRFSFFDVRCSCFDFRCSIFDFHNRRPAAPEPQHTHYICQLVAFWTMCGIRYVEIRRGPWPRSV